jgi:deazaflavin-dependent oxidoreductase (nitroreductase family)
MIFDTYQPTSWQRRVQKLAALPFFSRILAGTLHHMDPAVLNTSRGKYTATSLLTGLPVVWLITIGARSGKLRTTPLIGIPDGNRLVLVASYFGKAHHPSWYHNLKANPEVHIKLNGIQAHCLAQEVFSPEYESLWEIAIEMYPGYASYKQRANGRHIPLISLIASDQSS